VLQETQDIGLTAAFTAVTCKEAVELAVMSNWQHCFVNNLVKFQELREAEGRYGRSWTTEAAYIMGGMLDIVIIHGTGTYSTETHTA